MIYLDHGATSFVKPPVVAAAMVDAMRRCASPGRGGYPAAMEAADRVYRTRETAAELFACDPEQVVFTGSCTEGMNIAISTLISPGDRVVISGFEHNAVLRPLYAKGAQICIAGRKLFDWDNMLESFEKELKKSPAAAVFTHVSNVFGYILPVREMAALCHRYGVPFAVDAAQSAGHLPVSFKELGADFIGMPGHKGLLGPQGTGILLCGRLPKPLLYGGTGTNSRDPDMPDWLPDRGEPGTQNVPGIWGLQAGMSYVQETGIHRIEERERSLGKYCAENLKNIGLKVFTGNHQAGVVSFLAEGDCEEVAQTLGESGIAVRAGLHCAPLAHDSAGTLECGTVRVSFGYGSSRQDVDVLIKKLLFIRQRSKKI